MYIKAGELFNVCTNQGDPSQASDRKTIFAGDLMGHTKKPDRVSQIREQAQKKAHKIVSDVFASEKKLDDMIQNMKDQRQSLIEEHAVNSIEAKKVQEKQADLIDIDEVTQENDYAKELDEALSFYESRAESAQAGVNGINSALRNIQIERLKDHPMVDAGKQVEKVMKQASDEIIGQIRGEGMENMEEKLQEVVEKAKEEAAKKEEEKEKLEERKAEKEELEKMIEKNREGASDSETSVSKIEVPKTDIELLASCEGNQKKANQELEKLISNLEMIMDDLKGVEVDVNL